MQMDKMEGFPGSKSISLQEITFLKIVPPKGWVFSGNKNLERLRLYFINVNKKLKSQNPNYARTLTLT